MKDELKSMSSNGVWDLEEIPKGAKTVAVNGSTRLNVTPEGTLKDLKHDSWQRALRKENGLITMRHSLQSHVKIPLES